MRALTFFLFLFTFIIYFFGVSPSVFGGDSGDIILASWFGGVAHPPGYPLNTMLGWIFTHLPYNASVAFKANLMAAFLMAASISLLFLILEKLTKNFFVSLAASLILAFTPLFWLYAHIIEVFQLNLLLVGISVYFLFSWRETKKDLYLIFSFLFLGFAVFHHQTSVLLLPAYAYLILKTDKKIIKNRKLIASLAGFFALGFLPYLFIPFAAARQTPINWDDPVTLSNFIRLITRGDYGTFIASTHIFGADLKTRLLQFANFFLFLKSDFSILGLVLIAIGAIYSFFKDKKICYFILIAVFFTGPFFLFYASFPLANDFYFGLWERFVLLAYFLLAIYLGFGLKAVYEFIDKLLRNRIRKSLLGKRARGLLTFGILSLLPFYMFWVNYPKADLSNFQIGDWLGHDALASAEPNSILLIFTDTLAFNSQYIFYTQGNQDNIKLILAGQLRHLEYRNQVMRSFPDLKYPSDFLDSDKSDSGRYMFSLVNSNLGTFPVYSTNYYPPIEGYKWMTSGLTKKLVTAEKYSKDELIAVNDSTYQKFKYKDFGRTVGYGHFMTSHVKGIYYNFLIDLIDEFLENSQEEEALSYLDKATSLLPEAKDAYVRFGNIYIKNSNCPVARDNFEKALSIDKKDWRLADILSNIYGDCLKDEASAAKYRDIAKNLKEKSRSQDKI